MADSSRSSNRQLVESSFKFNNGGISRKRKKKGTTIPDEEQPYKIDKQGKKVYFNSNALVKSKRTEEDIDGVKKRRDSENSKEGEGEEEKDGSLDHNKMLKDIKISNNKLNMVTLSVILIFLTYFATCFGVSLSYLNQISSQVTTNT